MRPPSRGFLVLVLAASVHAGPAVAVDRPPVALGCEGVTGFVSGWLVAGEPMTRVVVKGDVTALAAEGDRAFTMLCTPPAPLVVCVEQSAAGLSVGDAVTLEGVVARADGAELVLDPCGSILHK